MNVRILNIVKYLILYVMICLLIFSRQCCAESENTIYQEPDDKDTVQIPDNGVLNMVTAVEAYLDSEKYGGTSEYSDDSFWEIVWSYTVHDNWKINNSGKKIYTYDEVRNIAYALFENFDGKIPEVADERINIQGEQVIFIIAEPEENRILLRDISEQEDGSVNVVYTRQNYFDDGWQKGINVTVHMKPNIHVDSGQLRPLYYTISGIYDELHSETDEKLTELHDNGPEEELFRQWIESNLESSFGICKKGSFYSTNSWETYGWCQQQGVVNSYCADFNGNGRKECLTIYLDNNDEEGISYKNLHLAVLTVGDSGIKKTHDLVLRRMDNVATTDLRVYIVEDNGSKYIILQNFILFNGCAENIFIFHITKKGKLYLDKWIEDPGYTSATALLRMGITGVIDDFEWNEDIRKTILYEVDIDAYCAEQPIYGEIMNDVLKEYGISVSVSDTMMGNKMWLFDERNNMKKVLHIYCSYESQGDTWKYNYVISDGTHSDTSENMGDVSEKKDEEELYGNEETKIEDDSDAEYIIPDSDSRYLTEADVENLTLQQINYAKNEIYARKGRKFASQELQDYFASKSWYQGIYEGSAFDADMSSYLNEYEIANSEFLSAIEYQISSGGYQLDQPGYDINVV